MGCGRRLEPMRFQHASKRSFAKRLERMLGRCALGLMVSGWPVHWLAVPTVDAVTEGRELLERRRW